MLEQTADIKIKNLGDEPLSDEDLVSSMAMLTAIQVHKQGDVSKAVKIYSNVLKNNNKSSDAACLLGVVAYDSGLYEEAEKLMEKATALEPDNSAYQLQMGRVFEKQGKIDQALHSFSNAIVAKPNPDAFINMGDIALKAEQFEQAQNCYNQAISMNPKEYSYVAKLAHSYEMEQNFEKAIAIWEQACKLHPANYPQRFMLVRLCLENKYNRQAHEHISFLLKNCAKLTPKVQLALASVCFDMEDYQGACILWQAVIKGNPQRADLYLPMAQSHVQLKKFHEAIIAYEIYLKHYPQSSDVYAELAVALFNVNKSQEALECMKIAVTQSPKDVALWTQFAVMLQTLKRYKNALNILYEANNQNPNNPTILKLMEQISKLLKSKGKQNAKGAKKSVAKSKAPQAPRPTQLAPSKQPRQAVEPTNFFNNL